MNDLHKLTIVIPTYERQKFLFRQVEFWKHTNAKVIILDGSAHSWTAFNSKTLPLNIEYFHIPESIERRFGFAISKLNTEYAVLLSDDEMFIPSALQQCIAELDRFQDYVVCKGIAIGFNYSVKQVSGFPVYKNLQGYIIDHERPEDRVNAHMSKYAMAVLWGVTRTSVFKRMLNAMSQGPFLSAAVGEMQCSIIAAWSGKIKVIDELMWLRSSENKSIWWSFGNLQFHDWFLNPANKSEVQKCLSSVLVNIDGFGYPNENIEKIIVNGIEKYIQLSLFNQKIKKKYTKPALSATFLVYKCKTLAKFIFETFLKVPIQKTLIQSAEDLHNSGIKIDFQQLSQVNSLIKEFHNQKTVTI